MSIQDGKNSNVKISYGNDNFFNIPFISADVKETTNVVDSTASISVDPNPSQPINGNKTVDGSFSTIFDDAVMPYFLIGLTGTHYKASNGEDNALFTHTFKLSNNLPQATILKEFLDTEEYFKYSNSKIGSFGISVSSESDITVNYNMMGLEQETNETVTSATNVPEGQKFQYSKTSLSIDDVEITCGLVESYSFDLNRGLEGGDFALCGGKRVKISEGAKASYDSKSTFFYDGSMNAIKGNGHKIAVVIQADNNPAYFKVEHTANIQPQGVGIDTHTGLKQEIDMKGYEDITLTVGDTISNLNVTNVTTAIPTSKTTDGASTSAGEVTLNGSFLSKGDSAFALVNFEYRKIGDTDWIATATETKSTVSTFTKDITSLVTGDEYEFRTVSSDLTETDFKAYGVIKEIIVT
jgi:hypothetical protein